MAPNTEPAPPSACPVDPAARAAWLETSATPTASNPHAAALPPHHPPTTSPPTQRPPRLLKQRPLAFDRTTSSIPRADASPLTTTPSPTSAPSPNAQTPSPATSPSGNWIYPSERMFFDAMARKSLSPREEDMALVVPIHNAVNERAWADIKAWELGNAKAKERNEACGGPRLRSFRGDSGRLTPRARVYGWLGYERPFDRHDWVVERCGEGDDVGKKGRRRGADEIVYIIDFYRGRGGMGNFYLDVRPKLNSWEGWRLRLGRFLGLG